MIDEKTVEQARNSDIIAFFEKHCGFTFAHRGGAYRCQQHQSLAVKNDRLSWYWHSKGIGGFGALDYLMKVENMPFREAVEAASGIFQLIKTPPATLIKGDYENILDLALKGYTARFIAEKLHLDIIKVSDLMPTAEERQDIRRAREVMKEAEQPGRMASRRVLECEHGSSSHGSADQPKTLILPEKAGIPLRLYDYLCLKRSIDGEIVNTLIQEEKLYEDRRGNVVFVGYDECGKARFASLRGTHGDCTFRMDCAGSDKQYSFNMECAQSERLYVFESPIDAMSHASIENATTGAWKHYGRLSLAGTSDAALIFFLNKHTNLKELVFCLDNDPTGREASAAMVRKYNEKGLQTRIELPAGKDFNEDLTAFRAAQKVKKHNELYI